jgi:lipoyl-dependent peroxiredoxin
MALSLVLGQAGFTPRRIHTTAKAHIEPADGGFKITHIDLDTDRDPRHRRREIPGAGSGS